LSCQALESQSAVCSCCSICGTYLSLHAGRCLLLCGFSSLHGSKYSSAHCSQQHHACPTLVQLQNHSPCTLLASQLV
jgi:hypothetical protein